MPKPGWTRRKAVPLRAGKGAKASICSPRPVARAGVERRKNGTSEPQRAARECRASGPRGPPKSAFKPSRVVAALPLPPPRPAASGIRFFEVQADALPDACRLEKELGGAIGQIARVRWQSRLVARHFKSLAGPAQGQTVKHRHGLHDRFQLVEPVGTLAQDVQQQVDLAGRLFFQGHRRQKKGANTGVLAPSNQARARRLVGVENPEAAVGHKRGDVAAAVAQVRVG